MQPGMSPSVPSVEKLNTPDEMRKKGCPREYPHTSMGVHEDKEIQRREKQSAEMNRVISSIKQEAVYLHSKINMLWKIFMEAKTSTRKIVKWDSWVNNHC